MKLPDILRAEPGDYVWAFTRTTNIKTIADAHRRLQSSLARSPHDDLIIETSSCVMVNTKKPYGAEPVLIVTIR